MHRNVLLAVSLSVILGIFAGGVCFGQIKSGTITGRVTDSSGAVVPQANVTVTNEGTKVAAQTQTSGTGDYTVPFLEPGIYDVTIIKEGFTTNTQKGINVGVAATIEVDATLSVGRTATVVEVNEQGAVALQTETSTVGDTVTTNAIADLPDINHNPYYFATLQPGVAGRWEVMNNNNAMSFGIGIYAHDDWSAFSFNGAAAYTASITLDGVNIQGTGWNEADVSPNPESIQEVKTYTNDYDASLGRGTGAVAIVTKSGTNSFHGSVFGRVRNAALNANSFANDQTGDAQASYNYKPIPKPEFTAAYYGGSIGGPIKKDKAFFFASWQGLNHHTQRQDLLNVPMNTQAKGDFASPEGCPTAAGAAGISGATATSNTLGTCVSVGGVATPIQLANPFSASTIGPTGATLPSGIFYHPTITGPAGISDLTQVADPHFLKYTSYYPAANRFPIDQYNDQNYFFQGLQVFTGNTVNSRVDLSHGNQNFYFSGGIEVGSINTASPWGSPTPPFYYGINGNNSQIPQHVYSHDPYGMVGDTITVSPTLVVDLRMGVNRTHYINANLVGPSYDNSQFGMPADFIAILKMPGAAPETPGSTIGQWSTLDSMASAHKNSHETNWDFAGGATKVMGKWTLKFGGEYMDDFTSIPNPFYTGGELANDDCGGCVYSNATVGSVSQNTTAATQGLAYVGDFMLGAGWWNEAYTAYPMYLNQYLGLYSANTWKVTPHLTLNLGLRWDLQPAATERFNNMMSWNSTGTNPIGTAAGFGAQGELFMPGVGGNSRRLYSTEYNNFGPRIGGAYRFHENTVIRGGYGITYLPSGTAFNYGSGDYGSWPWNTGATQNTLGPTPSGYEVYNMESANASPIIVPPGGNPSAPAVYGNGAITIIPHNYENGFAQQFNLFVERKVGGWLFSAGYSGSRGSRLPDQYFLNGENTALFNAPSVSGSNVIHCFHAGQNCAPSDSSVAAAGGYLGTGSDPYTQQVTNPFNPTGTLPFQSAYIAKTIARGLYDGPYPLFGSNSTSPGLEPQMNYGTSSYNSLQVEAKHQFGHGLMVDAFYVWSKSLSNSYFQAEHNQSGDTETGSNAGFQWNQIDQKANRRLDIDDVGGRFVANVIYQLPFGTGHSLNPGNKVASYVVGGWRIGATEMDQSGFPLDITDADPGSLDSRPNRVANEPLILPQSLQGWYNGTTKVTLPDGRIYTPTAFTYLRFNPDAFSAPVDQINGKYLPDTYWMGTSAINYGSVRAPSINNLNLSITRDFKLTERFALQFQANATNLLNHPNFQTYTTDLGSGVEQSATNSSNIPLGYSYNTNSYGTHSNTTFDFRQIEFAMHVRF